MTNSSGSINVSVEALEKFVSAILIGAGVNRDDAVLVAADLIAADVEGVASHGVMLLPMYVDRLKAGSISVASKGTVVSDKMSAVVLDANDALGQLTSHQAVKLATERARKYGVGIVSVRNAAHIGMAGRFAREIAAADCVGIVLSNTRPLMPPPGGAAAVTGNNPVAIAVPSNGPFFPEVDMALSAVAMGKIRNAAAAGSAIPDGWATDKDGARTTDPNAAINGMLLPAAGPKGFGLAFLIDLICGGLSDGAIGAEVKPLYGDPAVPYRCSNAFIAIDIGHFVDPSSFKSRAGSELSRVSKTRPAAGIRQVFAPGEMAYAARERSNGQCILAPATVANLRETARGLGVDIELTEK